jgi:hypothetical protein
MPAPAIQSNTAQLRVVDPLLTEYVRGYSNAEYVGSALFPSVPVPVAGVKRIEFGRDAFRRRKSRRAPGTRINQMSFGYEGRPVNLHQEALQAVVPFEWHRDAMVTPGFDLQTMAVDTVLAIIALEKEIQQSEAARNAASYAASNKLAPTGTDKWSNPTSDPKAQIFDAKEVIRKRIGRRPNTLVLSGAVASSLGKHKEILAHFRPTNASAVSLSMLASYFDIDNVVSGDAIYDTDDSTSVDVWGAEAVLAYVPAAGGRNIALPSYGYTYQLQANPYAESFAWDKDFGSHTANVWDEFSAELVGADAGFLFQSVL